MKSLQLSPCLILVVLRDERPKPPADHRGKQPARILGPNDQGVLGRAKEPQPIALTRRYQPRRLSLTPKRVKSSGITQVFRNHPRKRWRCRLALSC